MAIIKYKNVEIAAISACVPKNIASNHELISMMPEEEVEKAINSIGIKEIGNTSSASIPLTIVSEMCNSAAFPNRRQVAISGFGAGLSWATALVSLENTNISELIEY